MFIFDESTNVAITGTNISIVITGANSSNTYSTSNGTYYITDLIDGAYTIQFSGGVYAQKSYTVTVGDSSSQILNAYLTSSTTTVLFLIQDTNQQTPLEGVSFTATKLVNSTYIVTDSKASDLTGRVQISYIPNSKYCFILTYTNYVSKNFCLDPILFSTYTVNMDPDSQFTSEQDLFSLDTTWNPTRFYNNQLNNFSFTYTRVSSK
jgi:hypothetical protein